MRTLNAGRLLAVIGKGLDVPERGWNAREFAAQGQALMTTLHRVAVVTQRKAITQLAPVVQRIFKKQVERVVLRVLGQTGGKRGEHVDLLFGQSESLWSQAIAEVLNEDSDAVTLEVLPTAQSVVSSAYSRTNALLAQEGGRGQQAQIVTTARSIGRRITGIDAVTRRQLAKAVKDAINEGQTSAETARIVMQRMNNISASRALTIARTEMNNAWTAGTKLSLKQNRAVTHVSVIGCEAREANSPQYRGESTCNIQDVPMADIDQLTFHPNHTGNIVPSGFADFAP